jgi:hypothetical protein
MAMPQLKHIVVLMLENRSFDHMIGFKQSATYNVNGIDPANPPTNPISPTDPTAVPATPDAPNVLPFDVGHSVPDTNLQLFFNVSGSPSGGASNKGVVYSYSQQQGVTAAEGTAGDEVLCAEFAAAADRLRERIRPLLLCPWPHLAQSLLRPPRHLEGFIDNSLLHNYDIADGLREHLRCGRMWKIYSHDFTQAQAVVNLMVPEFDNN